VETASVDFMGLNLEFARLKCYFGGRDSAKNGIAYPINISECMDQS